jgi:hypothetical protein
MPLVASSNANRYKLTGFAFGTISYQMASGFPAEAGDHTAPHRSSGCIIADMNEPAGLKASYRSARSERGFIRHEPIRPANAPADRTKEERGMHWIFTGSIAALVFLFCDFLKDKMVNDPYLRDLEGRIGALENALRELKDSTWPDREK